MRVRSLHVYPVKACAGIDVTEAHVERRGLAGDRRWMLVGEDGVFVTQREEPRLCLVRTALAGEKLTLAYDGEELAVPRALASGEPARVRVWSSDVDALEHLAARAWTSRVLGRPGRLVFMPEAALRPIKSDRAAPGDIVSFADGFPVLLMSMESVGELERRAGQPFEMRRFRPNVVVDGAAPFAEDAWTRLAIGAATFRAPKACERCIVTTVDPSTAARGAEPLRTLATFRKWDNAVWFGVNLVPDTLGALRVGDAAHVLATA